MREEPFGCRVAVHGYLLTSYLGKNLFCVLKWTKINNFKHQGFVVLQNKRTYNRLKENKQQKSYLFSFFVNQDSLIEKKKT